MDAIALIVAVLTFSPMVVVADDIFRYAVRLTRLQSWQPVSIGLLVIAIIVCTVLAALVHLFFGLRRAYRAVSLDDGLPLDDVVPPQQGLGIDIRASFPTYTYGSDSDRDVSIDSSCYICLEEYEAGDTLCDLPRCSHLFHGHCIRDWFLIHPSCPLCRCAYIVEIGSTSTTTTVTG